jgi:hypothetical protein
VESDCPSVDCAVTRPDVSGELEDDFDGRFAHLGLDPLSERLKPDVSQVDTARQNEFRSDLIHGDREHIIFPLQDGRRHQFVVGGLEPQGVTRFFVIRERAREVWVTRERLASLFTDHSDSPGAGRPFVFSQLVNHRVVEQHDGAGVHHFVCFHVIFDNELAASTETQGQAERQNSGHHGPQRAGKSVRHSAIVPGPHAVQSRTGVR